jgi:DNA-binding NarL/FixJ family response regulator
LVVFQRSIIVVEDEDFLRSLIASAVEQAGFRVWTAATAADAKRLLDIADPDAVILDIELGPGPSGIDLSQMMSAKWSHVGILFLTELSDARFARRTQASIPRSAGYLNKNLLTDTTELISALEAVLTESGAPSFRHDTRSDRPMARLSSTQIQVLQLLAEGKSNKQIATIRKRSLAATEAVITRTLVALGIDTESDSNVRVTAARAYMALVSPSPVARTLPSA